MRLIDADALKEDILGLRDCPNGFSDTYDKACIIWMIDEQPTAYGGLSGWTCPVCGRGLSPYMSVCPCKSGLKGWEITC